MLDEGLFSSLRTPLSAAREIFVLLPQNPNFDQVAASLGLFLSLKKANKSASIACPTEMRVEFSDLVGVDKIQTELGGGNLVVSFDYLEDSIEKVSYNIENNKFNLVVQPKAGFPPLSSDKVAYSYSGSNADFIFTLAVRDLNELGSLYHQAKTFFTREKVVDIDLSPKAKRFGQIELILDTSSLSEIVVRLIAYLGLPADADIASNLLLGIEKNSRSFASPRVNAATFEAAAFCLRAGARRGQSLRVKKGEIPLKPMPEKVSAAQKPREPEEKIDSLERLEEKKAPSPDWFQPKIYKGNTKI